MLNFLFKQKIKNVNFYNKKLLLFYLNERLGIAKVSIYIYIYKRKYMIGNLKFTEHFVLKYTAHSQTLISDKCNV